MKNALLPFLNRKKKKEKLRKNSHTYTGYAGALKLQTRLKCDRSRKMYKENVSQKNSLIKKIFFMLYMF